MPTRREFLRTSALSGAALLGPARARAEDAKPAFEFAVDLETFWAKAPFLDRLKSLSDAGGKTFEFGRFKTKDVFAIAKAAREAELNCERFDVYQGLTDPGRKEPFLAALDDALEVAELLGAKSLVVAAGALADKPEADRQVDAVADALEAAAEKVKEVEILILLDPFPRGTPPAARAFKSLKDAVDLLAELNSDRLKLLVDLETGGPADAAFWERLEGIKPRLGAFRGNSARIAAGGEVVAKRIAALAPPRPFGYELARGGKPDEALANLRRAIPPA